MRQICSSVRFVFYMGLFEYAADSWIGALNIAKEINSDSLSAKARFNLAGLYIMLEDYQMAQSYLKETRSYFLHSRNNHIVEPSVRLMFLNNEAIIAGKLGTRPAATDAFTSGIEYAKEQGLKDGLQTITSAYITFLMENKAFEQAEEYLLEIIADSSRLSAAALATHYYKLSEIYENRGEEDQSVFYLQKAEQTALQLSHTTLLIRIYERFFIMYEAKNMTKEAFEYKGMVDSLKLEERAFEAERALLIGHYEDQFHKFEQEGKSRERKLMALGVMVLMVITALYVFLTRRAKNRAARLYKDELMAFQEQLLSEKAELESAIKEKESELDIERKMLRNQTLINSLEPLYDSITSNDEIREIPTHKYRNAGIRLDQGLVKMAPDFYVRLNEQFPDLTPNEHRLCGYLYLNLTSKEIALITGQTLRAVEMARIRLRKKLNLQKSDNLSAFLHSV
jgi:DNA-binding CsgD family transcriptional regulator